MFKDLASQKECEVLEGHLRSDPVHMLISIPLKYAVPSGGWFHQRKECNSHSEGLYGRRRNFTGQHFWARGY